MSSQTHRMLDLLIDELLELHSHDLIQQKLADIEQAGPGLYSALMTELKIFLCRQTEHQL